MELCECHYELFCAARAKQVRSNRAVAEIGALPSCRRQTHQAGQSGDRPADRAERRLGLAGVMEQPGTNQLGVFGSLEGEFLCRLVAVTLVRYLLGPEDRRLRRAQPPCYLSLLVRRQRLGEDDLEEPLGEMPRLGDGSARF